MFARKCLMLTSVSSVGYALYPRRCYASAVKCLKHESYRESYREKFEKLNKDDKCLVIEKYKQELTKAFGHSQVVSNLSTETIEDLHYILKMFSKPLSLELRILLRKKILPYLEESKEETQRFYEYILKYYEVM